MKFAKPTKKEKIFIEYNGYHPSLYSNNQAVQLPGFFPWYPISGKKQIYFTFDKSIISNYGYNPYNRSKSYYNIKIKANYPVVTNLNEISENLYKGYEDSLTLVGGYLEKSESQIRNFLPLSLSSELSYDEYSVKVLNQIEDFEKRYKRIFDIDLNLKEKRIIVASNGLGRTTNLGNYSEFSNYILLGKNGLISENDFLLYYLLKNNKVEQEILDAIILSGIINLSREELLENILLNIENEVIKLEIQSFVKKNGINEYFKKLGADLWEGEV